MVALVVAIALSASVLVPTPVAVARGLQVCDDLIVTSRDGGSGLAAAVQEANGCRGHQAIVLEAGTYDISSSLSITDTVSIESAEPRIPATVNLVTSGTAFTANGTPDTVTIRDVIVTAPGRSALLNARNTMVLLERVTFAGAISTCGVSAPNAIHGDNIDLEMISTSISGSACAGVAAFKGSTVVLEDVDIFDNASSGLLVGGRATITNSRIYNNGNFGITTESGPAVQIIGSHVYGNGSVGISQSSGSLDLMSSTIGLTPTGEPAGNTGFGIDLSFVDATLDTVEIAHNSGGVQLSHQGINTTNVQSISVHDNTGSGVHLSAGRHTFAGSSITGNGTDCTFGTGEFRAAPGNTDGDGSCRFVMPNQAPIAVLADVEVDEGSGVVTLDASASSDPDGDELTFAWSANVVPTGSQASFADTENEGEYLVSVEVCDPSIVCSTATAFVTVRNVAPELQITGPTAWTTNFSESITLAFSDLGVEDTHVVFIDWGDENFETLNDPSTGVTVAHVYTSPGPFTISVEVRDDAGDRTTATLDIAVTGPAGPSIFKLSASLEETTACNPPATDLDGVATTHFVLPAGWSAGSPEVFYCLIVTNNSADSVSTARLDGDLAVLEGILDLEPAIGSGESRSIELGSEFGATGSLLFEVTLLNDGIEVATGPVAIQVEAPTVEGAIDSWTTAGPSPETACNDQFTYDADGDAVGTAAVPTGISEMWLCVSMRNSANGTLVRHGIDTDPELPSEIWPSLPFSQSVVPGATIHQILGPVIVELPNGALENYQSVVWRSVAPPNVELFSDHSRIRFVPTGGLPTITIEPASATEGGVLDPGELNFDLTLRSSSGAPVSGPVSVVVQTLSGSAELGADYVPNAQVLDFVDDASQTFSVQLVGDDIAEPDEHLTILLSEPSGATVADPIAVGLIIDDDKDADAPPLTVRVGRTADQACAGELDTEAEIARGQLTLPAGGSAAMALFYCVTYINLTSTVQTTHLLAIDGVDTADLPFSPEITETIEPGGEFTQVVGPLALPVASLDELSLVWMWRAFDATAGTEFVAVTDVSVTPYDGELQLDASIWLEEPPEDCDESDQDSVTVPFGQGPGTTGFQTWYCVVVTNAGSAALVSNQIEFETSSEPRVIPVPGVLVANDRRSVVVGPLADHPSLLQDGILAGTSTWFQAITWVASGPGYAPGLDDDVVAAATTQVRMNEAEAPDLVRIQDQTVIEGTPLTLELTRGPDLATATQVYLATHFSSDATGVDSCDDDGDFIVLPGQLIDLPADGALPTLEILTCNDEVAEANERFRVGVFTLGDGGGLGELLVSAEIKIVDDGDIVRLDVTESDEFQELFTVSIPLDEPAESDREFQMLITGDVAFSDGCGFGNDVSWGRGFDPNQPDAPDFMIEAGDAVMEFEVRICGDGYPEPFEAATILVVDNDNLDNEVARWELTIEDEDPFPVLRGVDVDDAWEDLGVANSVYAKFEVVTPAEISWPFDFSVTGSGAGVCGFGADYQPPVIPVVIVDFADDEFELPIGSCLDAAIENDYDVAVSLIARDTFDPDQAIPAISKVRVRDDDEPPELPTVLEISASEGSGGGITTVPISVPVSGHSPAPEYGYRLRSSGTGDAALGNTCDSLLGVFAPADYLGVDGGSVVRPLTHDDDTIDFEVLVCADDDLEPNRVAWIEIWDAQDVRIVGSVALTIVDDDGAPTVRLFDVEVNEGSAPESLPPFFDGLPTDIDDLPETVDDLAGPAQALVTFVTFRIEILEAPTRDYSLRLEPFVDVNDTATAPSPLTPFCDPLLLGAPDYAWTSRSVTVTPDDGGEVLDVLLMGACADIAIEADETYSVQVLGEFDDRLAQAQVTIIDDDALPTIEMADVSVPESAGTLNLAVDVLTPANVPVWVWFVEGSAEAGTDYRTPGGFAVIPLASVPGAVGTVVVPIGIADDEKFEPEESFVVEIWSLEVGGSRLASAEVTIEDDDRPPVVQLRDAVVVEGSATEALPSTTDGLPSDLDDLPSDLDDLLGPVQALVTTLDLELEILVPPKRDYTLRVVAPFVPNNTASGLSPLRPFCDPTLLGPPDYAWTHRSITVTPEDAGRVLQLPVFGACADILIEGDESYGVLVVNEEGALLDDATITIIDDDASPVIQVDDVRVVESVGTVNFEVDVQSPANIPVWVRFVDGAAEAGSDYRTPRGLPTIPLVIAPGAVGTPIIPIPIIDDDERESEESFFVQIWDSPTGGNRLASAEVTIGDDDRPPQVRIIDLEVDEGTAVEFFPGIVDGLPTSLVDLEDYEIPAELLSMVTQATIKVRVTDAPLRPYTVLLAPVNDPGDTAIGLSSPAPFCDPTGLIGAPDYFWDARELRVQPSDEDEILEVDVYITCADSAIETDETYTVIALDEDSNRIDEATVTIIDDDALPAVSGVDVTVTESIGIAKVTFDVATPANIPLWVRTTDGTAIGAVLGGDFVPHIASGLPILPGGTGPAVVNVVIRDDDQVESDETFAVEVWDLPTGGTRLATATVTLRDDDRAPEIELFDVEVDEGSFTDFVPSSFPELPDSLDDVPASFDDLPDPFKPLVTRGVLRFRVTDAPLRPYDISIKAIGLSTDTAVGLDSLAPFCEPTGVLGVPDYYWSERIVTVTPDDQGDIVEAEVVMACRDLLIEDDEVYTIRAFDDHGATLDTAKVTILDDDYAPVISGNDVVVAESVGVATVVFDVTSPVQIPVFARTIGESAVGGLTDDFFQLATPFPAVPGATGPVSIFVPIINDVLVEDDETFRVEVWDSPVAGTGNRLATATVTITDDDVFQPVITSPSVTDVTEGDTVDVVFDIAQTPSLAFPVVIGFASITGSTNHGLCPIVGPGGDAFFGLVPAVITSGSDELTVPVVACADGLEESTERFYVTVSTPTGTELARAEVRIIDADSNGISIEDAWVSEGDGGQKTAKLTITVTGAPNTPVDVSWSAQELPSSSSLARAKAPADFQAVNGTLSFSQPGTKTVEVPINGDTNLEGDEWFRVTISSQVADVVDGSALVRIQDDERAQVSVGDATNVLEGHVGTTTVTFPVTISQAPVGNVTVYFKTHDVVDAVLLPDAVDFAVAGQDYVSTQASRVFSPGGPFTQYIEVLVKGNTILEDNRNVYLVATGYSPSNFTQIDDGVGRGFILDDDDPPVMHGANNIYVTLNSAGLAMRVYYEPTATDIQDFTVPVICDPESGSLFPVGETVVTCTATDSSGMTVTESFRVVVTQNDQQKVAIPQGPDITSAVADELIQFVAGGFAAHSRVELEIRSRPISLGAAIADERGVIDVVLTVPPFVPRGEHTLIATGKDPLGRRHQAIESLFIGTGRPVPIFTG